MALVIFARQLRALGAKSTLAPHPSAIDRALARVRRPLDRTVERRALQLDALATLSADAKAASREAGNGERLRILVASLRGWSSHSAYELVIAQALRVRGADVALLTCGGGMPVCEVGWARRAQPRPCDRCAWLTGQVADVSTLEHHRLVDHLPWGRDARGAPVVAEASVDGRASARNASWLLKASELERIPEAPAVTSDFAVAADGVRRASESIFDQFKPDVVFLLNGLFGAEHAIREVAQEHGVRAPTYEVAPRAGALVLSQGAAAPDFDVEQLWERVRDRPLSDLQHAAVTGLLADRARGVGVHESYFDRAESDTAELRRHLGLSGRERLTSLFTNVTWDSATLGHDIGFTSMFDWIEQSVRIAAREDLVLVIRVHPGEGRWGTREDVQETIVSRIGEIPENVRFVSAYDALSSYTLLEMSDLLLVYTTTLGLEAATRGKRVAVAGDTHYRARGFTTDVSGAHELARTLAHAPTPLAPEKTELALRYAHMFFFRAMVPFPLVEARDGTVISVPLTAAELAPGADRYLDWICERIFDGEHFGLPDELAEAPVSYDATGAGRVEQT
jgi:Capsule polysaccharide biosynthesis protein